MEWLSKKSCHALLTVLLSAHEVRPVQATSEARPKCLLNLAPTWHTGHAPMHLTAACALTVGTWMYYCLKCTGKQRYLVVTTRCFAFYVGSLSKRAKGSTASCSGQPLLQCRAVASQSARRPRQLYHRPLKISTTLTRKRVHEINCLVTYFFEFGMVQV
eukprot:3131784-Amphidinium_carterae.2